MVELISFANVFREANECAEQPICPWTFHLERVDGQVVRRYGRRTNEKLD